MNLNVNSYLNFCIKCNSATELDYYSDKLSAPAIQRSAVSAVRRITSALPVLSNFQ